MLTLEFKCFPSPEQKEKIEKWLQISKSVWNCGLSALEDFEANYYYYKATNGSSGKESGGYAPCCRLPWKYWSHFVDEKGAIVSKDKGKATIQAPYSVIYDEKSHWYIRELKRIKVPQPAERKESWGWQNSEHGLVTGYSCPLSVDFSEPLISRPGAKQSGGLSQVIAKKKNLAAGRAQFMQEVPYRFLEGVIAGLDTSWQEYTKSKMGVQNGAKKGHPRFKRRRDKVELLIANSRKGELSLAGNNTLKGVPTLGNLKLKGLDRRWRNPDNSIPHIATLKICKYASGYYIQLSGDLIRGRRIKQTNKSIGIDPGLDSFISLSNGKQYGNPRYYRNCQEELAKLQQELASKMTHRLILWLNHPERRHKDIKEIINCSPDKAQKLCQIKTEAEGVALIGGLFWQRLKWNAQPMSTQQTRIQTRISKLQEKIKRQRKAFNQKLSSEIVSNYQFISCENGLQSQNLRAKAKPQEAPEGGYKKNKKAQKSGLTKSLADAGHGDFIAQLEQKSSRDGRNFTRNPAAYTSQTCPVCLNRMEIMSNPRIKLYECNCGWNCQRDINAAVNDELALFAEVVFQSAKGKVKKWGDLTLELLQKSSPVILSKYAAKAKECRFQYLTRQKV